MTKVLTATRAIYSICRPWKEMSVFCYSKMTLSCFDWIDTLTETVFNQKYRSVLNYISVFVLFSIFLLQSGDYIIKCLAVFIAQTEYNVLYSWKFFYFAAYTV